LRRPFIGVIARECGRSSTPQRMWRERVLQRWPRSTRCPAFAGHDGECGDAALRV